jgi:type III secretory pathway component EscS
MSQKNLGTILIVAGVVVIVAVLIGFAVGWPNAGFGWKKITASVVGLVIALIGLGINLRKKAA